MQNISQLFETISELTRQFLNCWLEYVLSQPVDFDISALFYFVRVYVGFNVIERLLASSEISNEEILDESMDEAALPKLIPQQSYS
jgi:hypothetical protein